MTAPSSHGAHVSQRSPNNDIRRSQRHCCMAAVLRTTPSICDRCWREIWRRLLASPVPFAFPHDLNLRLAEQHGARLCLPGPEGVVPHR